MKEGEKKRCETLKNSLEGNHGPSSYSYMEGLRTKPTRETWGNIDK